MATHTYQKVLHAAGCMAVPGQHRQSISQVRKAVRQIRESPEVRLTGIPTVMADGSTVWEYREVKVFSPVPLPHESKRRGGGLRPRYRTDWGKTVRQARLG